MDDMNALVGDRYVERMGKRFAEAELQSVMLEATVELLTEENERLNSENESLQAELAALKGDEAPSAEGSGNPTV